MCLRHDMLSAIIKLRGWRPYCRIHPRAEARGFLLEFYVIGDCPSGCLNLNAQTCPTSGVVVAVDPAPIYRQGRARPLPASRERRRIGTYPRTSDRRPWVAHAATDTNVPGGRPRHSAECRRHLVRASVRCDLEPTRIDEFDELRRCEGLPAVTSRDRPPGGHPICSAVS